MNTERVLIGMGDLVNFNADKFGGRGGWRRNSIREFRVKNFEKFWNERGRSNEINDS